MHPIPQWPTLLGKVSTRSSYKNMYVIEFKCQKDVPKVCRRAVSYYNLLHELFNRNSELWHRYDGDRGTFPLISLSVVATGLYT